MSEAPGCAFTYEHYRFVLTSWVEAGLSFSGFRDDTPSGPPGPGSVLLRHDIDFDLESVLPMAQLEAELGVMATYFLRVTAPQYNALSERGRQTVERLVGLGHQVGLHFEFPADGDAAAATSRAQLQARTLEAFLDVAIGAVSIHRPGATLRVWYPPGLTNTYQPAYLPPRARYISDSNRRWREGCPCQHLAPQSWGADRVLQVLVHPEWWTENDEPLVDRVRTIGDRHLRLWDDDVAREITRYGEERDE